MLNSNKQIKFAYLQELANQSISVEWRSSDRNSKVIYSCFDLYLSCFYPWLFDEETNVTIEKKITGSWKNIF